MAQVLAESSVETIASTAMAYAIVFMTFEVCLVILPQILQSYKRTKKMRAVLKSEGTVAQVQVSNKAHYTTRSARARSNTIHHHYTCDLEWQAVNKNGKVFRVHKKEYHCSYEVWTGLPEQSKVIYWKSNLYIYALQVARP